MYPPVSDTNGKWARNNTKKPTADHLEKVFDPYEANPNTDYKDQKFSISKLKKALKNNINPKKAPGYDLVTATTRILNSTTKKYTRTN